MQAAKPAGDQGFILPAGGQEWHPQDAIPAGHSGELGAAQQVVRELHRRLRQQLQRWADYRSLFLGLAFTALYLSVLYSQRGAHASYQVHSTLESVVAPQGPFQSASDVYSWLRGLLEAVWVDPDCGDGQCEAPFEFASYGHFGCRADCGRLAEVQNLTAIHVDLYWDFSHPVASLPATELMQRASWNLCPVATAYDSACYFAEDQRFRSLAGEEHVAIEDVPDGKWELQIKRDYFSKVRGAVREASQVQRAALYARYAAAAAAVAAEQRYELRLLQAAVDIAQRPLLSYLPTLWSTSDPSRDAFDMQQLLNATCACVNGTAPLAGTAGFAGAAQYLANNCSGTEVVLLRSYDAATGAASTSQPANSTAVCAQAVTNLTSHHSTVNATLLSLLVGQRLGNMKDTGKVGVRMATLRALRSSLAAAQPELVSPVFEEPTGADALSDARRATLTTLATLFAESPSYLIAGAPAHLALYRRRLLLDPGMTLVAWGQRAQARIQELAAQQAAVAALQLPGPAGPLTVAAVAATFSAAGANATFMPAAASLAPPLGVSYDLVAWRGNSTAFLVCELHRRAPEYAGACEPRGLACAPLNDTTPYTCTQPAGGGAAVAGNLSYAEYREACELPCDRQLDCEALCECYGACTAGQVCVCTACERLSADATRDPEFVTLETAAAVSAAAAAYIATVSPGAARRLHQQADGGSNATQELLDDLAALMSRVTALRSSQDGLSSQMTDLQGRLDRANQVADARARDTTVANLIAAGRADIASAQATLSAKLDTLLQRQQVALDAVARAEAQVAAVKGMADKQAAALEALGVAVSEQLGAISLATQNNLITLYQALAYWKVARRERAQALKAAKLANMPCAEDGVVAAAQFVLDNKNDRVGSGSARDRVIGLSNRVVGGLLLHTWRTQDQLCTPSRFDAISHACAGPLDLTPYGVDPVFRPGSSSYDPDVDDPLGANVRALYNCSQLERPTFSVIDPITGTATNQPSDLCGELFNPRGVPYAFRHFPLAGLPVGFPIWFDINLSQGGARAWATWVEEGLLLDEHTRGLSVRLATYNAPLRVWGDAEVAVDFQDSGGIQVTTSIYTLRLELYGGGSSDDARFAAELAVSACVGVMLLMQLWAGSHALSAAPRGLKLVALRMRVSMLDLTSNLLMSASCVLWWRYGAAAAAAFAPALRYPVYADASLSRGGPHLLRLAGDGEGLSDAWGALAGLRHAVQLLSVYYALSGVNTLLLIGRLLRMMDFQPRLGVVTRSLARAAPDLAHFALVAGTVFIAYAVVGFLVFGNSVAAFAGFGASVNTCFEMLLGQIDVNSDLRALGGLQSFAGALFFWSYELLVFLVLLNFLLAIIVDAFGEVKAATQEQTGVHTDLARLAADKWNSLLSLFHGLTARAKAAEGGAPAIGGAGGGGIGRRRLEALLQSAAGLGEWDELKEHSSNAKRRHAQALMAQEPKRLKVSGEEVDEATLQQVLLACLAAEGKGGPRFGDAAPGGGGGGWVAGSRSFRAAAARQEVVGQEEVAAAARYLVERFGYRPSEEAELGGVGHLDAGGAAGGGGGAPEAAVRSAAAALTAERGALASALERLAATQRELADAQRALMAGQRQLGVQHAELEARALPQHAGLGARPPRGGGSSGSSVVVAGSGDGSGGGERPVAAPWVRESSRERERGRG